MAHQAQDTFVAELKTGPVLVQKGSVWADGHAVVKLDGGRELLFKPLDLGEDEPAAKRPRGRPRQVAGDVPAADDAAADSADGGDGAGGMPLTPTGWKVWGQVTCGTR